LLAFAGFARTYYLKSLFATPPLPSLVVHAHGVVMTAWVILFSVQVGLVSARRVRLHQRLGYVGIGLAVLVIVLGVWTALGAARRGSTSTPPDPSQPAFSIVPLGDILMFTLFFGGAVHFRRTPRRHKGLMLLTAVSILPPAIGRLPITLVQAHPLVFGLGIPAGLAWVGLVADRWRYRQMDRLLLASVLLFVASFPGRIALMATPAWTRASAWLATLVD
jgi:4-amino-4-deoxy-L-arabinose transferase-like glycosyltransferase